MSLPALKVRCTGCSIESGVLRGGITLIYRLPDGTTAETYRTFGWCRSCDAVQSMESRLSAKEIQAEIADLPRRRLFGFDRGVADPTELVRLEILLRLAQWRRSPPRCLECGGTDISILNFAEDGSTEVVHSCGGKLFEPRGDDTEEIRWAVRPRTIELDVEGNRI